MRLPTLAEIVKPEVRGNLARFAREMEVSWTTAWRWCLPTTNPDHVTPPHARWSAIEKATGGRWKQPPGVGLSQRNRLRRVA